MNGQSVTPHAVVAPGWVFDTAHDILEWVAQADDVPEETRRNCDRAAAILEETYANSEGVGDLLADAYVAGFKQSVEGWNAEYPHDFDDAAIREALAADFEEWKQQRWDSGVDG